MATKKARRDYRAPDGAKLPGVTTVIGDTLGWNKNGLIGWAHKLGREGRSLRERDDAADLGTLTHEIAASLLGGEPVDAERWTAEQIEAATPNGERAAGLVRERYDVLHVELPLVGEDHGGTIDYILRDRKDGALVVGDLKTSRTRAGLGEWMVQLGAYSKLWGIEHDEIVMRGVVVHAPAGETAELVDVSAHQIGVGARIFGCLLQVYRDRKVLEVSDG